MNNNKSKTVIAKDDNNCLMKYTEILQWLFAKESCLPHCYLSGTSLLLNHFHSFESLVPVALGTVRTCMLRDICISVTVCALKRNHGLWNLVVKFCKKSIEP